MLTHWRLERVRAGRHEGERVARGVVAIGACAPWGRGGSGSFLGLSGASLAEPPGLGAGVDDVCSVGEAVDDGFREARVGEHLVGFAEREVRGDDHRCGFVAFADHLEHELGGAGG